MSQAKNDNAVRISQIIAPSYYEVYQSIKNNRRNKYWFKGGRGSLKSSFIAIVIILGVMREPLANAVCFRKVATSVRKSIFETLLWAIGILKVDEYWDYTRSPSEMTYLPTGQKIFMSGLDDPRKVKSIKIKKGYFKFLWFEEADEFNGAEELRSARQSVIRGARRHCFEMVSFNPPNDPNNWTNVECEENKNDLAYYIHHSTYLDAPIEWLGDAFVAEAERLKEKNYLAYEHEYLGIAVGRAEQIVFHGCWQEKTFEAPINLNELYQSRFFYGADWGFSQDPTALIRCFILVEGNKKNLYIDYEASGTGVELKEISQLFDSVPQARKWPIKADCSRPETISFVKQDGFNIEGAPKWAGSIEDGVEYIKSFDNIFIHPRCEKTIEEFKKHSYKIDKNTRQILPIMVDAFNHHIDSIRYALSDYIKKDVSILDVL